jgi:uncharacterized repeat protein (TIGR03803 family)
MMIFDLRKSRVALVLAIGCAFTSGASAADESVVYSFTNASDGRYPNAPLIRDQNDNLYGTTRYGGANCDCGTVFKLTPHGEIAVLYIFAGGKDGANPNGGLVRTSDGTLYGTTMRGGDVDAGAVFKLSEDGAETVVHSFDNTEGAWPLAGLSQDRSGNLYGTTSFAGGGGGSAFKVSPNGDFTILHLFRLNRQDGGEPAATLLIGGSSLLYGTTKAGGPERDGTVYSLTDDGSETILHKFKGPPGDGQSPQGELIQDGNGNLYGTTFYGGPLENSGTIFRVSPDGRERILHSFGFGDGAGPTGSLLLDKVGNLYGTTLNGGGGTCFGGGCGTVFRLAPNRTLTTLYAFTGGVDGGNPNGALIKNGRKGFYGTTAVGGAFGYGVVFRLKE